MAERLQQQQQQQQQLQQLQQQQYVQQQIPIVHKCAEGGACASCENNNLVIVQNGRVTTRNTRRVLPRRFTPDPAATDAAAVDACCEGCLPIIGDAVIHEITTSNEDSSGDAQDDSSDDSTDVTAYQCSIACDASTQSNSNVDVLNSFGSSNSLNSMLTLARYRNAFGFGFSPLFQSFPTF